MLIDNQETIKFKFLFKMYTNCNQSVYIFLIVCYNASVGEIYEKKN